MDLLQVLTIILAMFGMIFYLFRKMDDFQNAFHSETKDFHGRLCALEEKYLKDYFPDVKKKVGRPKGSKNRRSK